MGAEAGETSHSNKPTGNANHKMYICWSVAILIGIRILCKRNSKKKCVSER